MEFFGWKKYGWKKLRERQVFLDGRRDLFFAWKIESIHLYIRNQIKFYKVNWELHNFFPYYFPIFSFAPRYRDVKLAIFW